MLPVNRLKRIWNYGRRIASAYGRHFDALMAAAISYYALLSVVPLLSVGVAILSWIVGSPEQALTQIRSVLGGYLPASEKVVADTLSEIKRGEGLLGLLGLAGLLLSASAIFTNLEIAFNNTWGVETMRGWLKQRLIAIGTSLLMLVLLFTSIGVTSLTTIVQNLHVPGTNLRAEQLPWVWQIFGHLAPLGLSVLMFTLAYKIIPNKPILWREAATGGAFAGMAWELAKNLFAVYLVHFGNYNKVYGSLGGIAILMVWAYYSSTILFLGAEIAAECGTKLPAADEKPKNIPCPQPAESGRTE